MVRSVRVLVFVDILFKQETATTFDDLQDKTRWEFYRRKESASQKKLSELPHTPTIIALGSILKKEYFVACQQLLFIEAVDFSEATCLLLNR
ncbi:hypothetical protein MRX96_054735 [Rhipicephalus microplus]